MKTLTKKSETIYVGKDAYLYLNRISRAERGCKPLSEEQESKAWEKTSKRRDGKKVLDRNSLGGKRGNTFTIWSVATLKKMLDRAGLPYEKGEDIEYIDVCL